MEDVADIIAMNGSRNFFQTQNKAYYQPSIDETGAPSIDGHCELGRRAFDHNRRRRLRWELRDEYGIYRDENEYACAACGRIIHVSRENIRAILERAEMVGHTHISLPEYAKVPTTIVPEPNTYSKAKTDELVEEIYIAIGTLDDHFTKRLDDIYYMFNNSVGWLTTRTDEMKQDLTMIQEHNAIGGGTSKSIDADTQPSIHADTQPSIDTRLALFEDRL